MTNQTLGTHKEKYLFQSQGVISPRQGRLLASSIISLAGMTPARRGRIDGYPYEPSLWKRLWNALRRRMSGGGGVGWTGFFPLMESYLNIDVYTDISEVEILLSTCKPERIHLDKIVNHLECHIGPTLYKRLT